jgi:hypothetical protein
MMELIVFLLQEGMIGPDYPLRIPELGYWKAIVSCQTNWLKPEFGIIIIKINIDVWRFTLLV